MTIIGPWCALCGHTERAHVGGACEGVRVTPYEGEQACPCTEFKDMRAVDHRVSSEQLAGALYEKARLHKGSSADSGNLTP